uniref:Uncharacterized protein n=1 Tax=Vespula pensylvanica TaxID=30213 RepID=A0A834UB54_VESPE|nr:hypothetical protein H0235_007260 [Vespula pensylvanica]
MSRGESGKMGVGVVGSEKRRGPNALSHRAIIFEGISDEVKEPLRLVTMHHAPQRFSVGDANPTYTFAESGAEGKHGAGIGSATFASSSRKRNSSVLSRITA